MILFLVFFCLLSRNIEGYEDNMNELLPCHNVMDVVLSLDASGSVLKENWNKSVDVALSVAHTFFSANNKTRVGIIDFSAVANEAIPSTNDKQKFDGEIAKLKSRYQNGITRTELALKKALEMFETATPLAQKVLFVVTDGQTTSLDGVKGIELIRDPINALKEKNVTIIAVGVHLTNDEEVSFMASKPTELHAFKIENFDQLQNRVKEITESGCPTEVIKPKPTAKPTSTFNKTTTESPVKPKPTPTSTFNESTTNSPLKPKPTPTSKSNETTTDSPLKTNPTSKSTNSNQTTTKSAIKSLPTSSTNETKLSTPRPATEAKLSTPRPATEACSVDYEKLGCFKDDMESPRPLPFLLFTDRDNKSNVYSNHTIDWKRWDTYVKDLVCRCSKAAQEKGFIYFSLQNYGDCWSGPEAGETYNRAGEEEKCITFDYKKCSPQDDSECVGEKETNFVYGIRKERSVTPTQKPATKCDIKYKKVGCFKDDMKDPRPLPEMIMTDKDEGSPVTSGKTIEWEAWDKYVPNVVCRCAQKAFDKKYSIFGIQYHGECWSGNEVGNNYMRAGQAETCTTLGQEKCPADTNANEIECVGNKETNYVYEIADLS